MAAPLTTKPQVSGYKFLLRRLQHAMIRRDTRMIHDPMRSQGRSVWVGVALAVLVCLGAGILALLRPQGAVGDNQIILGKDTGALYVRVGDVLHPTFNLASARLISGSSEAPTEVKDDKLGDMQRGPLLGIPGAPASLNTGGTAHTWSVCDDYSAHGGGATGVIAGLPNREATPALKNGQVLLASSGDEDYLLYEGKRARIDAGDQTVLRALDLDQERPREVSEGLLEALPLAPDIVAPTVDGAGGEGPAGLESETVGSVVKVEQATETEFYVVLDDGVQKIPESAASIIRASDSSASDGMAEVAPGVIADVPRFTELPVDSFPTGQPTAVPSDEAPISCVTWDRADGDPEATLSISAGRSLPLAEGVHKAELAGADGEGKRTDWFASPQSAGWFVQITDSAGAPRRAESLGYLTGSGVLFGIPDMETAGTLGLEGPPSPMPWSINRLLTPGLSLSRDNAFVAHDAVDPGDSGVPMRVAGTN